MAPFNQCKYGLGPNTFEDVVDFWFLAQNERLVVH